MASVYDILQEVGISGINQNTRAGQAILGKQQEIAGQNQEIATQAAPSSLAVAAQKNEGELAAQEAGRKVSSSLGNDPNDPNSLLSILVQDFRENTLVAREQAAAIAAKKQVGLFDDLPQFLINQVTLPDDINALKGTASKIKVAQDGIAAMQSLTTSAAQAAHATKQTLTKDSIRAQAEVDAAMLNQKINALKIDSLGYDLEAIKLANTNNAQYVQYAMAEHNMRLQDAAAARAERESQWMMQHKQDQESELDRYAKLVSIGAAKFELPAMNLEEIKARAKNGTPAEKARLEKMYLEGMSSVATGSTAIGSSTGEAIANAIDINGLKGTQNKASRDFLESVTRIVANRSGLTVKDLTTPEGKRRLQDGVNDYLYGEVDTKTGKRKQNQGELYKMALDANRDGSIYKAPALDVLSSLPSIQSNPLFETVIKPAVSAGMTKSDPAALYSQAKEAVKRGLINERQMALGLADFYKSVTAATYSSSGASKFLLPYYPSYNAKMANPLGLGGDWHTDWTKESNWLSYHTTAATAESFLKNIPNNLGVR